MKSIKKITGILMFTLFVFQIYAQIPLPTKERAAAITEFRKNKKNEVNLKQYLKIVERIYNEKINAKTKAFCPTAIDPDGCNNGDFENGVIDASFWQVEYGSVILSQTPFTNNIPANVQTAGLLNESTFQCGFDNLPNSRITIVSQGNDSVAPLLSTVPNSPVVNNYSLRIGNSNAGGEAEMVTKTFEVTNSNFIVSFDYAVVLQAPSHGSQENPTFIVRVKSGNQYVTGLVDLDGNGGESLIADLNNDFFAQKQPGNIVYTAEWQCATINLHSLIGDTVTLEFIAKDCSRTAHFGYAYIDNLCNGCGSSPTALNFNNGSSTTCGMPAQICFDYTLPSSGTLQINLDISQSGNVINNVQSPVLNTGSQYCFNLTQSDFGNANTGLVDFLATGNFTIIGNDGNIINIPSQHDGLAGYNLNCYDLPTCCPPMNEALLKDLFELVQTGNISADYQLQFNNNPYFLNLFQTYLDYIYIINPNIEKLVFHWRLIDAGDQITPNDVWSPALEDRYAWFEPGGGGNYTGNDFFSSDTLQINHWYKIHTGLYTEPAPSVFENCNTSTDIFYRISIQNGKRIGVISDGKKVLKTINFKKVKTIKRGRRKTKN